MDIPLTESDTPGPGTGSGTLSERVSALEERTRPKPRSASDRLKDWAGLASLAISIGITFPLGLWDRWSGFVDSRDQVASNELKEVRRVIEDCNRLMAEAAKTLSSIQDPTLLDNARRALYTQLHMTMLKHKAAILRLKDQLTTTEALVAANIMLQTEHADAARDLAASTHPRSDGTPSTRVESLRVQAKSWFMRGDDVGRSANRRLYAQAVAETHGMLRQAALAQELQLRSEWALLEMMDGDWACGEAQIAQARRLYLDNQHLLSDHGSFMTMVEGRLAAMRRRPQQAAAGCDG